MSTRVARVPRATYRVQFGADLGFEAAADLVGYLDALGVSHLYASPYLQARPGSTHGYDVVDPGSLNPEIGSTESHRRMVDALHARGMGHMLDVVPNHVGVMGSSNPWWLDALENGGAAEHAHFFDIDWQPPKETLRGKVLVPVLGAPYGEVIEKGELAVRFDADEGSLSAWYHEHRFPIGPRTYPGVLQLAVDRIETPGIEASNRDVRNELQQLTRAFAALPHRDETDATRLTSRRRDAKRLKRELGDLAQREPEIRHAIDEAVAAVRGDALHELLELQAYRLAAWTTAPDEINYRRFFAINDLAALAIRREDVFDAVHELVSALARDGLLEGLRVDHPDGLADPAEYFRRLRSRVDPGGAEAPTLYVVAEKILAPDEALRDDWPIDGTTGYDFARMADGVLVDSSGAETLDAIYERFLGARPDYETIAYSTRRAMIEGEFAADLELMAQGLNRLSERDRHTRDVTLNQIRSALREMAAAFPVYRTYVTATGPSPEDRRLIGQAHAGALARGEADAAALGFVRDVLLLNLGEPNDEMRARAFTIATHFQQYTSAVMAKGLEDTAFYAYNRLTSLNEVGGHPADVGISPDVFHRAMTKRAERWPASINATTTHDTKRSEDVRARIHVLSEAATEWGALAEHWATINEPHRTTLEDGTRAPSRNDEYLLYQTLVGTWPVGRLDANGWAIYRDRIEAYALKASREAKQSTSWLAPVEPYEAALRGFVRGVIDGPGDFRGRFAPFAARTARAGLLNTLSLTLLKLTAPGIPDIYQGSELLDLRLVDPDNRGPIDWALRQRLLEELRPLADLDDPTQARAVRALFGREADRDDYAWGDGRAKLWLLWRTLALRRVHPTLFEGPYRPLEVRGPRAAHLIAFARGASPDQTLIVIAPRLPWALTDSGTRFPDATTWAGTTVVVGDVSEALVNTLTCETLSLGFDRTLAAGEALANFPVALLTPAR